MDWLEEIVSNKKLEIEKRKRRKPLAELEKELSLCHCPAGVRSLSDSLLNASDLKGRIIGEIKRSSPSAGAIRTDISPAELAALYEKEGLGGISILTEEKYFCGALQDIRQARKHTGLPVLMKDFIIDIYQVFEAKLVGADAFLLIAEILTPAQARALMDEGRRLGMEVLVELHSPSSLPLVVSLDPVLVGINNRNLRTLRVELETTPVLIDLMDTAWKEERVIVSMSGISNKKDLYFLREAGADAFLVGTSLMKASNIWKFLAELTGEL